jgi:squalene-hopene/tetraprenyl-beta-curcumene cyclase
VTSTAILALVRANRPKDKEAIARARAYLEVLQADGGEGYSSEHSFYGGVGYDSHGRPDLSNLQLALEALSAAGLDPGDEAFVKAVQFLERTQNRSESNDTVREVDGVTVKSGNDGGGTYAPGDSKAGFVTLADGTQVPRSYGSMTYALLKSYLFAGLSKDDPRVAAAWKWCTEHYTLDVNPGFEASSDPSAAYQGLFYYFYTMAHALDLYGSHTVKDATGVEHDWRAEMTSRLVAMQRQDGSWINENSQRWYEGNPDLATAYALLVLDTALPDSRQ